MIAASLKNLFNLLIAFNLSDNFRVNFSYFHSKLEGTGILYSFEGTMKTYYPRMSFFPWNWVYFSYGYAFSTLNLDFSPLNQVGLNPVSHSHSESKMALAVGLDFKLLERFHFIFDYNIIKDYNQSVFTIALAL